MVDLDALCAAIERILTVDGDDPPIHFGRRAWPRFRVVDVAHLGTTVLCAFEQLDQGLPGKTLVWSTSTDVLPGTDDVSLEADIFAINFLEDLAVHGSAGWPATILVTIGDLTFSNGRRDLSSPKADGDTNAPPHRG